MPTGKIQPPETTIYEPPLVCIQISNSWIPYLLAMVAPAKYPEFWGGTLEQNRFARREVQNLLLLLSAAEDCMQECCVPPAIIVRVNPDTGRLERSSNGGETWTPDPSDPQGGLIQLQPPVTAGVTANSCDAASNAMEHFEDTIGSVHNNLSTAATIFDFVSGVVAEFLVLVISIVTEGAGYPLAQTVASMIWAAAASTFAFGIEQFDLYWDADKKDKVFCYMVKTIGDDGAWTEDKYQEWRELVHTGLPRSPALDIVMTTINAFGARGLSQMAAYGNAATRDCAHCFGSAELWQLKADGSYAKVLPDPDGTYLVTAEYAESGGYTLNLQFAEDLDGTDCGVCNDIVITEDSPSRISSYLVHYRCNDCENDPLSHCSGRLQYRFTGVATMRVTLVYADPCTS